MATQSQLRFGKELQKLQIRDIDILIQNRIDESQNLEYKEPGKNLNTDCNDLAKAISGFLNTDGGILVYGVSEKKKNKHRIPSDIKWCNFTKERLEHILKNKVQPWEERIKIYRISSKESELEGIFVMEIPKSNNPPHMCYPSYYHRLNFETEPMTHEDVFRTFQTSWIRRTDLRRNVIEPLYSEISLNCERIDGFEVSEDSQYKNIVLQNKYLYDQVEPALKERIDEFYRRVGGLNSKLTWVHMIANRIINEELCKIFDEHKDLIKNRMDHDFLSVAFRGKDPSGRIIEIRDNVNRALLLKISPESYLQSQHRHLEVIDFEPVFHPEKVIKIPGSSFEDLWESCKSKAAKNKTYLSIWDETPKLLTLGRKVLESMFYS